MKYSKKTTQIVLLSVLIAHAGCRDNGANLTSLEQNDKLSESLEQYEFLAEPPKQILDRMLVLNDPDNPEWQSVVDEFIQSGNPIVPATIGELMKRDQLKESVVQQLESRIAKRFEVLPSTQETFSMLELAAYADLVCHRIEYPLRVATLQHVQLHKDDLGVRNALQWITTSYRSQLKINRFGKTPDAIESSMAQAMNVRMAEYANALLQAKTTDEAMKNQTPARAKFEEPKVSKRVHLK